MSIVNEYLNISTEHAARLARDLHHQASLPATLAHPPEWPSGPGIAAFSEAAQAAVDSAERRADTLHRVARTLAELSAQAIGVIDETDRSTGRQFGGL
ncbi:hypothetical protein L1O03_02305 [Corynebacterium uropygiale]|uniref:Uncharacterized protein n=1 Tax=Corynebacterium uropygiale TaxID=1775911 RepID=A0A9X1QPV8_9CORY|nr:hypothetical protein [Corynebacterium uropygiale]MCF4006010.1 hypothetical protein [Corynebacterium uropygiale]